MASRNFQSSIPMFSRKNYDDWTFRMKIIFDSYELSDIFLNGYVEPIDESTLNANQKKKFDENRQKNKKALQIIGQALDNSILGKFKPSITAKKAWDILETAYQGTSKVKIVKLQALRRDFENLQMKDFDSMEQFLNCVMNVVNQIRMNGDELTDQRLQRIFSKNVPLNLIILQLQLKNLRI